MKKSGKDSDESGKIRLLIERAIRAIPRGKVSTYGEVARAVGMPGAARLVARVLRRGFGLPWQRVLGAGGAIKLTGDSAIEGIVMPPSETLPAPHTPTDAPQRRSAAS